jgi:hypothetical protein
MQQGQQQETKLLQGTRLVLLLLPRAVTILQGQQAAEEEQQQADQQQVKVRAQAAALQGAEVELPAALKVEAVIRSSTITTTDREPLGLLIFLIFALCIG